MVGRTAHGMWARSGAPHKEVPAGVKARKTARACQHGPVALQEGKERVLVQLLQTRRRA
ncbi:MAG: hypothetical protein N2595_05480 [bacterium]|nr:hypothetical protein [bacterium]